MSQGMSLPTQHPTSDLPTSDEKSVSADTPCDEKEAALDSDLDKFSSAFEDEKALYVNGEPVITSGRDVSRYLVDLRDDEDPPLTFRSAVLGTVIGGLGAALFQVRHVQSWLFFFLDARVQHSLVDLYFQTGSNRNLDGVSAPRNLLIGDFMVDLSSEAFSG